MNGRVRALPRAISARLSTLAAMAGLSALAACGLVRGPEAPKSPAPPTAEARAEARADSLLHRPGPPVGLKVADRLRYPTLRFDAPAVEQFKLSNGVTVFFLEDHTLPVVDAFIDLKGGYVFFDRDHYAAAAALLPMMRNGGTLSLPPDSVDDLIELNALSMNTSTDGARLLFGVGGLRRQMDLSLGLWGDMLLHPRFDSSAVERWRRRELESARNIADFPGSLAVLEFNRIMYGDHPTGWMMTAPDLAPDKVTPARLREMHRQTVCPEGAVIGAAGDVTREEMRAALEKALAGWRPCGRELKMPPPPTLRREPGIYVIPKTLSQSTIVVGQPGGVLLRETPEYFASRIANWVIGGSGVTSRLMTRLRTEEGLAYSAASIWGAAREHERIFGAITHTKSESTVAAVRLLLGTLDDALVHPPDSAEVKLARESIVNGFVFGFSSPVEVVARQVAYMADGFPPDWLTRYLDGIRAVDSTAVADVLHKRVDPRGFSILIVGDTTAFDMRALGDYTVLAGR